MRLRNRKSFLTSLPEGRPERTVLSQVTHWTYISVLVSLLAYFAYIGISRFVYFKGVGIIEIDKTNLSPINGGEIISLKVEPGDIVRKDQVLATLKASKNCIRRNSATEYKLKHDLSLLKFEKDTLAKQIKHLEKGNQKYLQRALEVNLSDSYIYQDYNKKLARLHLDLTNINAEYSIKTHYLKKIQYYDSPVTSNNCTNEIMKTPFSGIIYAVSAKENEFAQRGKPLVTLVKTNQNARVEAYLSNDYLQYLHVGKEIAIQFPDGAQSRGIIHKIESNATLAAERKWHGYDPVKTRVRATIMPLDPASHQKWGNYDRMLVEIQGVK